MAVDKWKYRLQYREYFGGVTAMRTDLFKQINGFSNLFYGWGGEDDDLFNRIKAKNISVYRQPANIAKFTMLKHDKVLEKWRANLFLNPHAIRYRLIFSPFFAKLKQI